MRRAVLPATILSLALVSAAWASPMPLTTQQVKSPDIVDVGYKGDKKYYKNKNWKYGTSITTRTSTLAAIGTAGDIGVIGTAIGHMDGRRLAAWP
jgi:hypothetical protein